MRNLYSITTNPAAIAALFQIMNRYVGNLPQWRARFPAAPHGFSTNHWNEVAAHLIELACARDLAAGAAINSASPASRTKS
jgi:hypothetical protein